MILIFCSLLLLYRIYVLGFINVLIKHIDHKNPISYSSSKNSTLPMFFDDSFISMKQTNPINTTNLKDPIHKIEAKTKPKSQICEIDPKKIERERERTYSDAIFGQMNIIGGRRWIRRKGLLKSRRGRTEKPLVLSDSTNQVRC